MSSLAKFRIMICFQPLKKIKITEKMRFHRLKSLGQTLISGGNVALLFFCNVAHSQS